MININNFENKVPSIIKSKSIFNNDKHRHRYILSRIWDDSKGCVSVILFNPSYADDNIFDITTMKVMNYLVEKGECGGIYFLNLYTIVETDSKKVKNKKVSKKADEWIKYAFQNSYRIYIGWGSNKNNINRINEIIKLLKDSNKFTVYRFIDKDSNAKHPARCTIDRDEELTLDKILG